MAEKKANRKLVLQNGLDFLATGFGADRQTISEIVFNTSMVGYQEIVSDPSYTDQTIVMSYPLIGNYGITDDDFESTSMLLLGLVVREYNDFPSNFRYTKTLSELMAEQGVPGISGVDTRMLVRTIRDHGSMKAMITSADTPLKLALEKLEAYELAHDQVKRAGSQKRWYRRTQHPRFNVAVVDCGAKRSILTGLLNRGCNLTVFPHTVTANELLATRPDGVLITNGPGDPRDVPEVIALIKAIRGKLPVFGICLGHQLCCLAYGARTYKLKFGHRGGNHPVKRLWDNKVEITSQNHSYAVAADSIVNTRLEITHLNLLDNTVEGVSCQADRLFSVQYHPESAPGPQDSEYLFDRFISMMESDKSNA